MRATPEQRKQAREQCRREGHEWRTGTVYAKCERCGKLKRNPAPVRVQRVVPDTGEIIEQTRPERSFRPERDDTISREFTTKVLAGERPGLIFPGDEDCPLETGQEVALTADVSIVVHRVTKTKGGDHRCKYAVRDFRETLIRRTPPSAEPPETDEEGFPVPHTKEAIDAATIDGSYTQDPRQAIPSGAPEVDVEYRRVLGTKSRARQAERNRKEQPMQEGEEDIRKATSEMRELARRAARAGLNPTEVLAPIFGQIKAGHDSVSEQRDCEPSGTSHEQVQPGDDPRKRHVAEE